MLVALFGTAPNVFQPSISGQKEVFNPIELELNTETKEPPRTWEEAEAILKNLLRAKEAMLTTRPSYEQFDPKFCEGILIILLL